SEAPAVEAAEPVADAAAKAEPVAAQPVVEAPVATPEAVKPAEKAEAKSADKASADKTPAKTGAPVSARPAKTAFKRVPAPAPVVDEDRERARRASEAEAAALREMLSRPRKVLKAPEPEAGTISGTLHKPAGAKAGKKDGKAAAGDTKKVVKATEVSTSWTDD